MLISAMATASLLLVGCGSENDTKANVYPDVEAGNSFTITEEETVTLSGSATDEDGSIVSTLWTQVSGPAVTLSKPNYLDISFVAPRVTEQTDIVFQLSATDDGQSTSVDNVTITVEQVQIANVSEAFAVLERRNEIPVLDRDSTLYGVDSDSNGIRDDIDLFIKNENLTPVQVKALNQMAASLQEQVSVDIDDGNAITIAAENGTRALNCVVKTFQDFSLTKKYSKTLQAYTANTYERTQNYLRYNHKLDGTVSSLPTENTCL